MGMQIDGYWLRTEQWFFKWNKTTEVIGLYDMANDPRNDNDLSEENQELVANFQEQIDNWISERSK